MDQTTIPIKRINHSLTNSSTVVLLLLLMSGILIGNIFSDIIIIKLNLSSEFAIISLDSTLLLILVFPLLYFLVFHPLISQIKERKEAEDELKNSLSLLDCIIESIHNGILVVNDRGTVVKCNARFAKMWNIPCEILNTSDDKKIMDYVLDLLSDPDGFKKRVLELYNNPEEESTELISLKDGRIFRRVSKPLYIGDKARGKVWSFFDITERKKAEDALKKSEAIYRNLVEKLPDGIYKSTHEGQFVDVNPAMVEMLGYNSKEELMAVDIKTQLYFDPTDRESAALEETMKETGIFRMKKKDGSEIWVEDHGWYSVDEDEKILLHEGIIRNFTERKKAEEEIIQKNKELLKVNTEKDKFFSIIAHDLRGPLSGFMGLSHIMAEELNDLSMDEIQQIAEAMKTSAIKLSGLVENLLEWAKMQQGLIFFEPKLMELLPVARECGATLSEYSNNKRIDITYNIPDNIEVFADNNMLQSIIRNLISNAVKYTHEGGKVSVSAKSAFDNRIEVAVKDTGIGMNPTMIDHLFRPDLQSNRKGTFGEPSSGLGLMLCKEFIEKHGGGIWVESVEGDGSVFYFTIPAKIVPLHSINVDK